MSRTASLYLRLMLIALAPMILASACAFLIALTIFTRTLDERASEQTEHAARVLAGGDLPLTPGLLQRVSALQRADFYLLDPGGHIAMSSRKPAPAELQARLGEIVANGHTVRFTLAGVPVVATFAPFDGRDPRYRDLVVVSSLLDARAAARRAAFALAGAVAVSTVLLALLVRLLVGQIARSLAALVGLATSIGSGHRGLQVPVERDDELGQLARALNEMVQRIELYESRLADQSRLSALGEMAARIAHEVRNPLTGLKMHLQLLAERLPGTETARVRLLLNEIRRLELVVEAPLTMASASKPRLVESDLAALCAEVIELMRPTLEHRHIELTSHLAPVPSIWLDPSLLKQALLNLIANASDALPEGGRIDVGTAYDAASGEVRVAVEDSGAGFPPEALAGGTLKAPSGKPLGLGLGLVICREVAELHGGALAFGVSRLGGAQVSLRLPLESAVRATPARCSAI